jgi:hypothetical protein
MRVFVSVGWPHDKRTPRPPRAAQELGGNAACVVEDFRDGELEAIVPKLIFGAFYQSGQSCISVQRLLIREARRRRRPAPCRCKDVGATAAHSALCSGALPIAGARSSLA